MAFPQEKKELAEFLNEFMPKLEEKAERPQRVIQQVLFRTQKEPSVAKELFELILKSDSPIPSGEEVARVDNLIVNHPVLSMTSNHPQEEPNKSEESNSSSSNRSSKPHRILGIIFVIAVGIVWFISTRENPENLQNTPDNGSLQSCKKQIEEANKAILVLDKIRLENVINEMKICQRQETDNLSPEFYQKLYDAQYSYAIDLLANNATQAEDIKKAVKVLCEIPKYYYEQTNKIPWFRRWSNKYQTNQFNFEKWLDEEFFGAESTNQCPAADFLKRQLD